MRIRAVSELVWAVLTVLVAATAAIGVSELMWKLVR